jgi:sarcosine oxidase subunit beta
MSYESDVIIIGGGIHGASLAFHLAQKGVKSLVLEKKFLAAGATGRSGGLVRMHYDLKLESQLAWISFRYFQDWHEIVGGESGFTRTGFLQLVSSESLDQLQANVRMHQDIGIPSLLIDNEDVRRLAPSLYVDDIEQAAFEPESGYADPSSCTAGFLNAARDQGANLIQDCEVVDVISKHDRILGVQTSQGEFLAPIVVNAAGPWAGKIGSMVGLDLPIDTWRHDTMFIKRPLGLRVDHPTIIDFPNSLYFRPETGGLTLVGLEDNNPLGEDPDGDSDNPKPGFVDRAVTRICKRIPGMDAGSLHSAHGGYDGITPDQRAILGQAGPDGFYLVCGFSGTGFKIAPAVGACVAELIVDERVTTADISPFSPQRFSDGDLLKGEHAYESFWR